MAAIGLIGAVLHHQMHEILRGHRRDGDEAAEIHQEAAVTLQADDALVRPAEREAERMRGVQPHGADREIVERALAEREPVDRRAVGRDHDLVGHVPLERAKAFVSLHHDIDGLRPTRNATGWELA